MAQNDIYNNEKKYKKYKEKLKYYVIPPEKRTDRGSRISKYYIKYKDNIKYFFNLITMFESRDTSYVRRVRLLDTLKMVCFVKEKDLGTLGRGDMDEIMAFMHGVYASPKSKEKFVSDLVYVWRLLFPERDQMGRIDDTIKPYPVRHLKRGQDVSRVKLRKDRLTFEEYKRIVEYFNSDAQIQFFIALETESLRRPQETLYRRIGDVKLYDNYAKIVISDHGKEGPGLMQCIDSYPYLLKWLKQHPFAEDKTAYLFTRKGRDRSKPLTPVMVNKELRKACTALGIDKPITCYSLKRNGVTFRRMRGEPGMEIQHAAGWTSIRQLKTYDMTDQEDAFKAKLERRGLLKDDEFADQKTDFRVCPFCGAQNGFTDKICRKCSHIIDQKEIKKQLHKEERLEEFVEWLDHNKDIKEYLRTTATMKKKDRLPSFMRNSNKE